MGTTQRDACVLVLAALSLAGCGEPADSTASFVREVTAVAGPDLVHCWLETDPGDYRKLFCGLVEGGPVAVTHGDFKLQVGSQASTFWLNAGDGASNLWGMASWEPIRIDAALTVDGSAIAGVGHDIEVRAEIAIADPSEATDAKPVAIKLPFALWNVELAAKKASLGGGTLYGYPVPTLAGDPLAVGDVTLPAVALGESTSLVLAAAQGTKVTGDATVEVDGVATNVAVTIDRPGSYAVGPKGLGQDKTASLPVAASCWIEPGTPSADDPEAGKASALLCKRGAAGGLVPVSIDVTVTTADGGSNTVVLLYDRDADTIQVWGNGDTVQGLDSAVEVTKLGAASYPATIAISAGVQGHGIALDSRNGAVIGLGSDDAFADDPLQASRKIASADALPASGALEARLPVALWKVTFVTSLDFYFAELDPYTVTLGVAWNGLPADGDLQITGLLPSVTKSVPEQTFFLPVDDHVEAITGNAQLAGASSLQPFTIAGPGRYRATANGLAAQ
jgi:hypothetical protein